MKQNFLLNTVALLLLFLMNSCQKDATRYKDLLDNREVIYPGTVGNLVALPGNLRVMLQWTPSPDATITKYMIYWNNNLDSTVIDATGSNTADTVKVLITGLQEYVQNFVVYTIDGDNNRSIGQSISGVRMYGPLYISSLVNRSLDPSRPTEQIDNTTYKMYFAQVDSLNISTEVRYINTLGQQQVLYVDRNTDSAILTNFEIGIPVARRSSYIPVTGAIDTFLVTHYDTLDTKSFIAGDYHSTGTLDRPATPQATFDEVKPVIYQGNNVFKFQIAPSIFNNNTLQVYMSINTDNSVTILPQSGSEAGLQVTANGPCTFDPVTYTFRLKYMYLSSGNYRHFDETMQKQ